MVALFSCCRSSRGSDNGWSALLPPEALTFPKLKHERHHRRNANRSNSDLASVRAAVQAECTRFSPITRISREYEQVLLPKHQNNRTTFLLLRFDLSPWLSIT